MEHFKLEGYTYFQQGRRCNKPGCRCEGGDLHGPYWFTRDESGHVSYLGRRLPEDVEETRAARDNLAPAIQHEIDELQTRITSLRRLSAGDALTHDDYLIVKEMGYGGGLLSGRRRG